MSRWQTLDLNGKVWPQMLSAPGCYVIFLDGKIGYIGQSTNIKYRLITGHGIRWAHYANRVVTPWGRFGNVIIKVAYAKRYGDWAMRELRLIRRLQPEWNRGGIQRRAANV